MMLDYKFLMPVHCFCKAHFLAGLEALCLKQDTPAGQQEPSIHYFVHYGTSVHYSVLLVAC